MFYIPDFHRFSGCQTFALLSFIRGIAPRRHAKPSGSWDGQAVEPVWIPGNETGHPEHEIRLKSTCMLIDGDTSRSISFFKKCDLYLEAQITILKIRDPRSLELRTDIAWFIKKKKIQVQKVEPRQGSLDVSQGGDAVECIDS